MDSTIQLDRTTLKDWESRLAPQVRRVELLGEIPITADECVQLGKVIGLRVRALGHSRALRALRHDYPCAFAVYLVAQGIYGYQGGDYWSEVVQVTGLKSSYTWQVGQTFEEVLADRDIPFEYEVPLRAPDGTFYLPDFTITWRGEKWYWEHLGMLHDQKYRNHWDTKRAWYEKHGFADRLITTSELFISA